MVWLRCGRLTREGAGGRTSAVAGVAVGTSPLKEQPVRPQKLPLVPAGMSTVHVWPRSSYVPPPIGMPASHMFCNYSYSLW